MEFNYRTKTKEINSVDERKAIHPAKLGGLTDHMYILRLAISFVVVFGELYMFDPWKADFYLPNYHHEIMWAYVFLSMATGLIGAILTPVIIHGMFSRSRILNVLNVGIVTFIFLSVVAILLGPYHVIDFYGGIISIFFKDGIFSHFFSEWNFTLYIFQIAFPYSFVAAGLEFFFGKNMVRGGAGKPDGGTSGNPA
jgi:hypothetical protein